ncbi:MAG: hypothetical protein QOJ35_3254 [Solirubrobacteraceae bacterium]|jgi:hypothetical protein|nr:hypothetical protein [Solirubrobacteraceae bacterium]
MPNLMTSEDDILLDELRRVFAAIDPVPEAVRIAARAAIEWRSIDAELADLTSDSSVDEPALAVRGTATPRLLTFEARDLTIEVEAEPAGDETLRLVGQIVPPQTAQIAVRYGHELVATCADERGRFVARGVDPGFVSLRCHLGGESGEGRLVETAWLSL